MLYPVQPMNPNFQFPLTNPVNHTVSVENECPDADLISIFDYEIWAQGEEEDDDGELTTIEFSAHTPPVTSCQFQSIPKSIYRIIGYVNGEDHIHKILYIDPSATNVILKIENNNGEPDLAIVSGARFLTEEEADEHIRADFFRI